MNIDKLPEKAKKPGAEIVDAETILEGSDPGIFSNGQETTVGVLEKESNLDSDDEKIEGLEQTINAFQDAEKRFGEIRESAEKLKNTVPEINSHINSANSAISAFYNIRESDEKTKENLILRYLSVLNKAINSINKLIEDNKDKLEENQDEKTKPEVDTTEEFESLKNEKLEIISQFSLIESKFDKVVNKVKSIAENAEYQVPLRVIELGRNTIKEFNDLAKTEPTEESLNQLEGKKRELESVITSLAKKVGEMEGVESGIDRGEEDKVDVDEIAGESGGEKENIKEESSKVENIVDFDEVDLNNKDENDLESNALDKELNDYQKAKHNLLFEKKKALNEATGKEIEKTSKEIYKDNEKEYKDAIKNYYDNYKENRSRFGKVKDWGREFLGLKPELPDSIKALEDKYKLSRKEYAEKLRLAMKERGKLSVNEEFHKDRLEKESEPKSYEQKVDRAFLKKFVLRPGKEVLDLQKNEILTEEQVESVKRIMLKLKKSKWYIRGGMITGAAVVGALSGSLAVGAIAASTVGARMVIGTGTGMLSGWLANKGMSFRTKKAEARTEKLIEGENFSVADIDRYEEEVMEALRKAKATSSQQTAVSAVAGIAGGFAGAYYAPDSLVGVSDVVEKVSDKPINMPFDSSEVIKRAMENNPEFTKAIGGVDSIETPDVADSVVETSVGEPKVVIEKLNVPIYSAEHPLQVHNFIEDISLDGADGLSSEQMNQITQFIQLKANDILSGEPHMTPEKLGTELQSLLEKRFGGEIWWQESPISKVDIGNITKVGHDSYVDLDSLNKQTGSNDWTEDNEVVEDWREHAEADIETQNIYEVQPGDKLWTIMKEQYGEILNQAPASEHNQILAQLFSNVKANPELLESLNLQSGDDIHKIYPDEKINIGPLGEELKRIVELGQADDLPIKGATGSLGVEADGPAEKIPINFAEQGQVDSGFDFPMERPPVNFAENGIDNPFTTVAEVPASTERIAGGAETIGTGKEIIQFATKVGTPTELTLRMNEFVQQTASEMLARNPDMDPTSFKNAVWQAFAEEFRAELNGSNQMILSFEPNLPDSKMASTMVDDIPPPPPGTPPGVPPDFVGQVSDVEEKIPSGYVEKAQVVVNKDLGNINMATSMDNPTLNQIRAEVFQNPDKFEKAIESFAKAQEDRSIFDFNDSVFETVGNNMTINDLSEIVQMGKTDALAYLEKNNIDVSYEELKGWKDYIDNVSYDPINNPNGLLVTDNTTLRNLVERDVVISAWMEKYGGQSTDIA